VSGSLRSLGDWGNLILATRLAPALSVAVAALLFAVSSASAAPLRLTELNRFNDWIQCVDVCPVLPSAPSFESQQQFHQCRAACGDSARLWEKDGVLPVTRRDFRLAVYEVVGGQACYRGSDDEIVVPAPFCAGDLCLDPSAYCDTANTCGQGSAPGQQQGDTGGTSGGVACLPDSPQASECWLGADERPTACPQVICDARPDNCENTADSSQRDDDGDGQPNCDWQCADADADGLPNWLEHHVSLPTNEAGELCGSHTSNPCGFTERCVYDDALASGRCMPRACASGSGADHCTAFHMELVSVDDQQAIVWLYYDYSPVPATVLDLRVVYARQSLVLQDARPLAALSAHGKTLASSNLADGRLRLSVYDQDATSPIATGPIIELIFLRTGSAAASVAFDLSDSAQEKAIAPLQGSWENQRSLYDDRLWGDLSEQIPALDDGQARLRLWYGFDDPSGGATYSTVPGGEELCSMVTGCVNETDEELHSHFVARLDALQKGTQSISDGVDGVNAGAAYLDGSWDHLRLPLMVEQPLLPTEQSFTFSTWFYTEGNIESERKRTPQLLFSHDGYDERTRFGLLLRPQGGGTHQLSFFTGDILSVAPPPRELVVQTGIEGRKWHHVALAVDASSGGIEVFFDGVSQVVDAVHGQAAVSCPQLFDLSDVVLHEEGDVVGGKGPEALYAGIARGGLYQIRLSAWICTGYTRTYCSGMGSLAIAIPTTAPFWTSWFIAPIKAAILRFGWPMAMAATAAN